MFRLASCSYRKRNIQLFQILQRWVKFESVKAVQVRRNVGLFFNEAAWLAISKLRERLGWSVELHYGSVLRDAIASLIGYYEVAQKCESKFVLRNRYNDFSFRNASKNGGACAERKMSQSLITFHSPQRLGILCPLEPGRLLDYLSTSKTLKDLVYFLLKFTLRISQIQMQTFSVLLSFHNSFAHCNTSG